MYLSRITLHTSELSPAQLLHLVERGEYVMHQWLWDLFPAARNGSFFIAAKSYRARSLFVLSQEQPAASTILTYRLARLRQC
ncbi:CRISPR-associated protein Cse3 family [Salmonella enterica subsp. enterica]|uniref:CRISPR-associated protein Cse3 family n=1 Tax=Salmonella enterica I TaxID=59201 RepID=A0A379W3V7_SALET|nr:CRISPR-associated protein Cse3 family [Salmonella enterica subsp. enterica]